MYISGLYNDCNQYVLLKMLFVVIKTLLTLKRNRLIDRIGTQRVN